MTWSRKPDWGFKGLKKGQKTHRHTDRKAGVGWAVLGLWSSTNYNSNPELLPLCVYSPEEGLGSLGRRSL